MTPLPHLHERLDNMANKAAQAGGFAPILAALSTMQSNVQSKDKTAAHEFLEKFQKSVGKEHPFRAMR